MTLDFDQLLDATALRQALAEATGAGVRVAVVDTGVDVTHPDLAGIVDRSIAVTRDYSGWACRDLGPGLAAAQLDPVGHGTACAGIIHELAPAARLVSVRVIGADSNGTGDQFVRGLRWVLSECQPPVQVVNLSLGTTGERFAGPLRELVDKAYWKGLILVAAGNNMGLTAYPANFASLIAVDNEAFNDPWHFDYRRGKPMELAARGTYVRAPKTGGGHQLFTGTSFACPHITAVVARLLSINPTLTPFQVKALLHLLRGNRATAAPPSNAGG
jgi:subtilisin family serine protease